MSSSAPASSDSSYSPKSLTIAEYVSGIYRGLVEENVSTLWFCVRMGDEAIISFFSDVIQRSRLSRINAF